MKLNELIDKITNNWVAKIICFTLAILIYFFHQVSMLDKKDIVVPLEVKADGALFPVEKFPPTVKVIVRAEPNEINLVTKGGIKAILDITNYTKSGSYSVPIEISLSNLLKEIDPLEISVKPDKLLVKLEEKAVKYVPVELAISGVPESGYKIASTEIVPSSVKVIGPVSVLENTNKIYTKKINVKGAKTNFSVETELDNINSLLEIFPESKFKVSVYVDPIETEKLFENVVPVPIGLKDKFEITSQIMPINVLIFGMEKSLEQYKMDEKSVTLDCSKIDRPGEYEIPIDFSLPKDFVIVDKSKSVSKIVIEKKINKETIIEQKENVDESIEENNSNVEINKGELSSEEAKNEFVEVSKENI